MTKDRWLRDSHATQEAERLFRFIGAYVVAFQHLEGKIDEMLLLARGQENRDRTFKWLAQKTTELKIKKFDALVKAEEPFRRVGIDDWYAGFDAVIKRLHQERERRNGLMHGQFLFDFLGLGGPTLRTHVKSRDGGAVFDQEWLSPKNCEIIMGESADMSLDLGRICVQLSHSYVSPAQNDAADCEDA